MSADAHSAPAVGRAAVLEALRSSAAPLSAADLAAQLALHPNTVRGHLELLVHLGYAARSVEERTERGRPKILYQAVEANPAVTEAYRGLATALVAEFTAYGADEATANRAGEKWADALAQQGRLTPQPDAESALEHVAALFSEMGYQATTEPMGDRLYLQQCPYRELVELYPSVCSLHLGLMRAAFTKAGGQVEVDKLDADVRPGLCVATLRPREQNDPQAKEQA